MRELGECDVGRDRAGSLESGGRELGRELVGHGQSAARGGHGERAAEHTRDVLLELRVNVLGELAGMLHHREQIGKGAHAIREGARLGGVGRDLDRGPKRSRLRIADLQWGELGFVAMRERGHAIADAATAVALSGLIVLLVIGVARRWRWLFWLVLVAFLAGVLRVGYVIMQLAGIAPITTPRWYAVLQGLIGAAQVAVGTVILVDYRRHGIWGRP